MLAHKNSVFPRHGTRSERIKTAQCKIARRPDERWPSHKDGVAITRRATSAQPAPRAGSSPYLRYSKVPSLNTSFFVLVFKVPISLPFSFKDKIRCPLDQSSEIPPEPDIEAVDLTKSPK